MKCSETFQVVCLLLGICLVQFVMADKPKVESEKCMDKDIKISSKMTFTGNCSKDRGVKKTDDNNKTDHECFIVRRYCAGECHKPGRQQHSDSVFNFITKEKKTDKDQITCVCVNGTTSCVKKYSATWLSVSRKYKASCKTNDKDTLWSTTTTNSPVKMTNETSTTTSTSSSTPSSSYVTMSESSMTTSTSSPSASSSSYVKMSKTSMTTSTSSPFASSSSIVEMSESYLTTSTLSSISSSPSASSSTSVKMSESSMTTSTSSPSASSSSSKTMSESSMATSTEISESSLTTSTSSSISSLTSAAISEPFLPNPSSTISTTSLTNSASSSTTTTSTSVVIKDLNNFCHENEGEILAGKCLIMEDLDEVSDDGKCGRAVGGQLMTQKTGKGLKEIAFKSFNNRFDKKRHKEKEHQLYVELNKNLKEKDV